MLGDPRTTTKDTSALRRGKKRRARDDDARHGSARWWVGPKETLHERLRPVTDRIERNSQRRWTRNLYNALMYGDVDPYEYYGVGSTGDVDRRSAITLNVVKNAIQTAGSMIAKNKPKPIFLTDGGDYDEQQRGEDLSRYVAGVFDDAKVYDKSEVVFRDGGVYGTGFLHFFSDVAAKKVRCEWVFPNEMLVDDVEGLRERPSQIHRRKLMARDELIEMFSERADEILDAPSGVKSSSSESVGDVVNVIESWHLKSGPKAKDGIHAITIEGATLLCEAYDEEEYPIIPWRWDHACLGFWGQGIADEIGPIQRAINRTLSDIDESTRNVAVPVLFEPVSAGVSEDEMLSNEIGRRVKYYGTMKPEFGIPPAMAADVYSHVWQLEQRAYNIIGIQQAQAQGQKQPGLDSGEAIREAADISSGRFQLVGQRWEAFFSQCARVVVALSQKLFAGSKDLDVMVKGERGGLDRIKWSDVSLEADKYRISVFEISALPQSPAGRIQTLLEWRQQGLITNEHFMSLVNIPDLNEWRELETATLDLVRSTVARIKRKGLYDADAGAIPEMNLKLAADIVTKEIVLAHKQQIAKPKIALLRVYASQIHTELAAQTAPPPAPANDAGGGPPGQQAPQGPPQQQPQAPPMAA